MGSNTSCHLINNQAGCDYTVLEDWFVGQKHILRSEPTVPLLPLRRHAIGNATRIYCPYSGDFASAKGINSSTKVGGSTSHTWQLIKRNWLPRPFFRSPPLKMPPFPC